MKDKPSPTVLSELLRNRDRRAGISLNRRKAGLGSADAERARGWPNLKKAWAVRTENRRREKTRREDDLRRAQHDASMRRYGIDPEEPYSYFRDLPPMRGI